MHTSGRAIARFALAACIALGEGGCAAAGSAETTSVDAAHAPIVRISVRHGDVTVRTWARPVVEVDGDASLTVNRQSTHEDAGERSILIPQTESRDANGLLVLPAESFVSAPLPPGDRQLIVVRGTSKVDVGAVTVRIPADSAFVFAHAAHGDLEVHDYHTGTLVGFVGRGRLALYNVGGTVFAQTGFGPLTAEDSQFEHLRARSLHGNLAFTRCDVRQIEATTIDGSIVYDNGSFEAGLARFESMYGDVAVGSTSPAQLGGRTIAGGHVYTNFGASTAIDSREGQTDAILKGGGPVVTATSEMGNVFLYEGSLLGRAQMPPEWAPPARTLQRPQAREHSQGPRAQP